MGGLAVTTNCGRTQSRVGAVALRYHARAQSQGEGGAVSHFKGMLSTAAVVARA